VPGDRYKSPHELIHLLVKIVSRGGNFLLNIGPGPDGDLDPVAYDRLKAIGEWMKINGEGIYNSRPLAPYSSGTIYFTRSRDEKNIYAFYLSDKDDIVLPGTVTMTGLTLNKHSRITLLSYKEGLSWKQEGDSIQITIPAKMQRKVLGHHAVAFRINVK
jgi:alpha-L-fucosidase